MKCPQCGCLIEDDDEDDDEVYDGPMLVAPTSLTWAFDYDPDPSAFGVSAPGVRHDPFAGRDVSTIRAAVHEMAFSRRAAARRPGRWALERQ